MKRMFAVVVLEELFHKATYIVIYEFTRVTLICSVAVKMFEKVKLQSPFFSWHLVSSKWFHFYKLGFIKEVQAA